jgi:RNA polymerase sigma factor (sigma-70 family)
MSQERLSFRARREREEKISFFARCHENAQKIRADAQKQLRAEVWEMAEQVGLKGTGFDNCIEDWVQEGYIQAEEQFDSWKPELGPSSHWVFMKARDIANICIQRLKTERRKLQLLIDKGSPLVHGASTIKDPLKGFDNGELVADLLAKDLSRSDALLLKLHHQGFEIEEIAMEVGLSKETAQRRLNRAQARARDARATREIALGPRGRPKLVAKPPSKSTDLPFTPTEQQRRLSP